MNDKKLYLTTDKKIFNFTYEEILKLKLNKRLTKMNKLEKNSIQFDYF